MERINAPKDFICLKDSLIPNPNLRRRLPVTWSVNQLASWKILLHSLSIPLLITSRSTSAPSPLKSNFTLKRTNGAVFTIPHISDPALLSMIPLLKFTHFQRKLSRFKSLSLFVPKLQLCLLNWLHFAHSVFVLYCHKQKMFLKIHSALLSSARPFKCRFCVLELTCWPIDLSSSEISRRHSSKLLTDLKSVSTSFKLTTSNKAPVHPVQCCL